MAEIYIRHSNNNSQHAYVPPGKKRKFNQLPLPFDSSNNINNNNNDMRNFLSR